MHLSADAIIVQLKCIATENASFECAVENTTVTLYKMLECGLVKTTLIYWAIINQSHKACC